MKKHLITMLVTSLLAGCHPAAPKEASKPTPQPITANAIGHYCSMNLAEHIGPKGQIFLNSDPSQPIWFSTIKQLFGYTKLPEEPKGIKAIYVTDMGQVKDWQTPNADNAWIDATQAYYVINSTFIGGMGAEDALPFASQQQAEQFIAQHGGQIVRFHNMPESYIFQ